QTVAVVVSEDFTLHCLGIVLILGIEDDETRLLALGYEPLGRVFLRPRALPVLVESLDDLVGVLELMLDQVAVEIVEVIARTKAMMGASKLDLGIGWLESRLQGFVVPREHLLSLELGGAVFFV